MSWQGQNPQFQQAPRFIGVNNIRDTGDGGGGGIGGLGGILGLAKAGYDIFASREEAGRRDLVAKAQMGVFDDQRKDAVLSDLGEIAAAYVPQLEGADGNFLSREQQQNEAYTGLKSRLDAAGVSEEEARAFMRAKASALSKEVSERNYQGQEMILGQEAARAGPLVGEAPQTSLRFPGAPATPAQQVGSMVNGYEPDTKPIDTSDDKAMQMNAEGSVGPGAPAPMTPVGPEIQPPSVDHIAAKIGEPVDPAMFVGSPDHVMQVYNAETTSAKPQPDERLNQSAMKLYQQSRWYGTMYQNAEKGGAEREQLRQLALLENKDQFSAVSAQILANYNVAPVHREFTKPQVLNDLANYQAFFQDSGYQAEFRGQLIKEYTNLQKNDKNFSPGQSPEALANAELARIEQVAMKAWDAGAWESLAAYIKTPAQNKITAWTNGQKHFAEMAQIANSRALAQAELLKPQATIQAAALGVQKAQITANATESAAQIASYASMMANQTNMARAMLGADARQKQTFEATAGRLANERFRGLMFENKVFQDKFNNMQSIEKNRLQQLQLAATMTATMYNFKAKIMASAKKSPAGFDPHAPLTPEMANSLGQIGADGVKDVGGALNFIEDVMKINQSLAPSGQPVNWPGPDGNIQTITPNWDSPEETFQNLIDMNAAYGVDTTQLERDQATVEQEGEDDDDYEEISYLNDAAKQRGRDLTQAEFNTLASRDDTPFKPYHYPIYAKMRNRGKDGNASA